MPVATPTNQSAQHGTLFSVSKNSDVPEQTHSPPASSSPSAPPLIDLYSASGEAKKDSAAELKKQILKGLKGLDNDIVPGDVNSNQDLAFKFKRTLPTTILYDEAGLLIYDKLVDTPEYYLFQAELSILKQYGTEIALRAFGHPTLDSSNLTSTPEKIKQQSRQDYAPLEEPPFQKNGNGSNGRPEVPAIKEKWGDQNVGRHNNGVNGEEGMDNGSVSSFTSPCSLVELGAGSLRKTLHLIRALEGLPKNASSAEGNVTSKSSNQDNSNHNGGKNQVIKETPDVRYFALDLDKAELQRTLQELKTTEGLNGRDDWTVLNGKVEIGGMWSTYDQGLDFIGKGGLAPSDGSQEGKRCLLWLGSSIGNFSRREAADFLKNCSENSLRSGDTMLISIDRRNDPQQVAAAYHDQPGLTEAFIMNGLTCANNTLGQKVFDLNKFEYHDRYNAVEGRHESYFRSKVEQEIEIPGEEKILLEEGELLHVESSYKYSERETLDLFDAAGLRLIQKWTDASSRYDIWLVEKPSFHFQSSHSLTGHRRRSSLSIEDSINVAGSWEYDSDGSTGGVGLPTLRIGFGLPTLQDWELMWKAWDTVTLTMIPERMLHEKPIDLRHICLFYTGHIPAFIDIHLSNQLGLDHINPRFSEIFERGIDPHVDDSSICHSHSDVPTKKEDWPVIEEILSYKGKVNQKVIGIYSDFSSGKIALNRRLARAIWMVWEHIAMHMETLIYMLVQSPNTLPPAGFTAPDWATLVRDWKSADEAQGGEAARQALLHFKGTHLYIGHDDDESKDFDFKVTKPSSDVAELNRQLGSPEFGWDNESPRRRVKVDPFNISASPISNGEYLKYLKATGQEEKIPSSWVKTSEVGLAVRTVYGPVSFEVADLWPVQAAAVELEAYAKWRGGRLPTSNELRTFLDATSGPNATDRPGTNTAFSHWHPIPSALPKRERDGTVLPGHNGGVWEWTSTVFEAHEGFIPSTLYPGYSADFHDGKHRQVLGGSWATTPSIAGRRTFVNQYQSQYSYVFAGARVAFDGRDRSPSSARA